MILFSITSAIKYAIGLMLVMLGFIPYEALEKNDKQSFQPMEDTVISVSNIDSGTLHPFVPEYCYSEMEEVVLEVNQQFTDTSSHFVIRQPQDTVPRESDFIWAYTTE